MKGLRDVVSEVHGLGGASARAAQSARDTRDSYGPITPPAPARDRPGVFRTRLWHAVSATKSHRPITPSILPVPDTRREYEEDQAPLHARYAQQVHAEDDEHISRARRARIAASSRIWWRCW